MKRFLFFLFSMLMMPCVFAQYQDTINYNEGGYLYPSTSYDAIVLSYHSFFPMFGNIYNPDQPIKVSGISCISDSCRSDGITLILAKYIGPDSVLCDSLIDNDTMISTRRCSYPRDVYYQIIDSIRLSPGIPPTRKMLLNGIYGQEIHNVFDAFFDSVYTFSDTDIYFTIIKINLNPKDSSDLHNSFSLSHSQSGTFYTYTQDDLHHSIKISSGHPLSTMDELYSYYNNPPLMDIERAHHFYGVFPIIDSLYELGRPRFCPPVPSLEVSAEKRVAHFTWNSDTVHCAYELSFGNAGQSYSTYTSVVTTDTEYVFNSMIPYERYACRLRAMCCFDDGDSIWSPWSDTLQYERPRCTVLGRSNDNGLGYVVGSRDIDLGDTVDLMAVPRNSNCRFLYWHTGDTANPLYVKAVCDTMLWAYFEQIEDTTTHGGDDDSLHTEVVLFADGLDVEMMPNPADNNVTFNCPHRVLQVELCDIHGRHIMQQEAHSNNIKLSLAGIPSGVYVAKVRTTKGWAIKKLVISHR